jgi:hypothetical protein
VVFNLYSDGKFKKAVHKGHADPYLAAERQVRSEIEAAQAERLRLLIPNPYVELTRRRLAMTIGAQQENDRDQLGEEPARNDRSPRWGRGWCVESGDPIVYGQVDGGLVFIPVEKPNVWQASTPRLRRPRRGANCERSCLRGSMLTF